MAATVAKREAANILLFLPCTPLSAVLELVCKNLDSWAAGSTDGVASAQKATLRKCGCGLGPRCDRIGGSFQLGRQFLGDGNGRFAKPQQRPGSKDLYIHTAFLAF